MILCGVIIAQTSIKIYNQGWALVQEERQKKFSQTGEQTLLIPKLPPTIDPSSINLFSEEISFLSKEYIFHPVSIKSLLDSNVGSEVELVKYGEDGSITFSTIGKLLNNVNVPIFEIDGKIVINPPYNYRFSHIPDNINNYPYLNCLVNSLSISTDYYLTYFTHGIEWEAEFNLYLISDAKTAIEGWYSIRNDNNFSYDDVDVALVSGDINFGRRNHTYQTNILKSSSMARIGDNQSMQPESDEIGDYFLFHIPEKINLPAKSQIRNKFLNKEKLSYNNVYHMSHSLSSYRRNIPAQTTKIPVYIRMELYASDLGNFQIPGGQYKVYEKDENELTYIGAASHGIAAGMDVIKLEIGKTHDILCTFTVQEYKIDKNRGEAQVDVIIDNRKNKSVIVKWIEHFSNGNWEITTSKQKHVKLDAYRAEFTVEVPANSKKEVSIFAKMEKD